MAWTVKKLIAELEKVENKFLEVEIRTYGSNKDLIYQIKEIDKKLLILIIGESDVYTWSNGIHE